MTKNGALLEADQDSETTYTVDTGDQVVLECCNVGSEFLSTVQWKHGDDDFIVANDNIALQSNTLTFAYIGGDDGRSYQCVVGGGLAESGHVLLKVRDTAAGIVEEPLTVSASSSVVCASPGGSAMLSCMVTGMYDNFRWVFNGKFLDESDLQLQITDIQQSDAGMYRCRATVKEGVTDPFYKEAIITLDLECKLPKACFVQWCVCA